MGSWGSGNFDNDTAADHLSILASRLSKEIASAMDGEPVEIEPDEYWGVAVPCNVELLALLAGQRWVGAVVPTPATIASWKKKYLAVWDAKIDALGPSAAWKRARRAVLVKTFDRLTSVSVREERATTEPASIATRPEATAEQAKKPSAKRTAKKGIGKKR